MMGRAKNWRSSRASRGSAPARSSDDLPEPDAPRIAAMNPPRRQDPPANDLISTNRSQSEERSQQYRAEKRGGQAQSRRDALRHGLTAETVIHVLGTARIIPVQGRRDRGLRRPDGGRTGARAAIGLAALAPAAAHLDRDRPAPDPIGHRPQTSSRNRDVETEGDPEVKMPAPSFASDRQLYERSDEDDASPFVALPISVRDRPLFFSA
jgi:hypothetical protein